MERERDLTIEFDFWRILDIFRMENIQVQDYYVILLLLSLKRKGFLHAKFFDPRIDFYENLEDYIKGSKIQSAETFLALLPPFKTTIKTFSNEGLNQIIQILNQFRNELIRRDFSEIFDLVLFQIANSQGRFGGNIIQPLEVTRFIIRLADIHPNSNIFNPFAGLASFGVFLDQSQQYYGQELNQRVWALGTLRLMAYNQAPSLRFVCDDSLLNWPNQSEKFDLIFANPPYGIRLNQQFGKNDPNIRTIEQFLIEKGVNSLNETGKLITILPQGFLFRRTSEKRLRQYLIEEDLIDTIISLPGGLLSNTGIPLVVLVINKSKKTPRKVRFVDAKSYVISISPNEKRLNDYSLNNVVHRVNQNSDAVRIVDNSQIIESDYNLNVNRYFQKSIDGIKLGDICEVLKGKRSELPDTGRLIRIRDLKDDKVDFKLDISQIEVSGLRTPNLRRIAESCLLLAIRWKTLKPTLFEFSDTPIYLNLDILCFKVNEEIADTAYLINELYADYVQEQLESYRLGGTIPFIRKEDLLEIVIKLPSLNEQRAKVQGIEELSEKIKVLQFERNAIEHGKEINQFNEFASLKHTLGRPRQNILDWTDNLLHFLSLKRDGFESLNKAFFEFYETDILSALKEVKRDINFMTDILEKGENGFVVEEYEKTLVSLSDINILINELSSNGFNFKLKKLILVGEKLKERGVYGNIILLKTLIDNLLTNANKYGFKKKTAGNEVVFELKEVDDFLSMEVRNNGNPFPKNFDKEKFITKYSTADSKSGSGLGGYDIHRIATVFKNADWELVLNEDFIYPVKFKFQFPIKLIS